MTSTDEPGHAAGGAEHAPSGWIDALAARISFAMALLASMLIVAMMLLVVADVSSRNLLGRPLDGVSAFIAYGVVTSVFLQIGSTIRAGRLVSAEFLSCHVAARAPVLGLALDAIFALAALAVLVLAAYYLWDDFAQAWIGGEFVGAAGAFQLRVWPFKLAVALGATMATVELFLRLWRDVAAGGHGTLWRRAAAVLAGVGALVLAAGIVDVLAGMGLGRVGIGFASLGLLLGLIALGMPIALALMVTSFVGIWLVRDNLAVSINSVGNAAASAVRSYGFGVIPLFVLMGLLLDKAGVGRDAFQVMALIARRVTGGLGIATVGANAVFASITGSSIASATVFTRIAAPPMIEAGYDKRFALGIVAGSSVLGMLIPPSLLMIVYGLIAEVSIGDMFVAGIVPGLLLSVVFAAVIFALARFAPSYAGPGARAGAGPTDPEMSPTGVMRRLGPVVFIVAMVMGGIYTGFFSPTEAGAMGAFGAVLVALARGSLGWVSFRAIVLETGAITAGLAFLMIAANLYGRMLAMTTIPMELASLIAQMSLTLTTFVLIYALLVVCLGMILDSVSIMLIVLPIALPILAPMGADLVWFGIITVVAIEIGLLTPPFGLSVYVVKGSLPPGFATLGQIFGAAAPFVAAMAAMTVMIIFLPWLATALL